MFRYEIHTFKLDIATMHAQAIKVNFNPFVHFSVAVQIWFLGLQTK